MTCFELDIAEDRTSSVRVHPIRVLADCDALQLVLGDLEQPVVWHRLLPAEDVQVQRNAFET
jgi:hypothetical protein